jgi:hypothetical protein
LKLRFTSRFNVEAETRKWLEVTFLSAIALVIGYYLVLVGASVFWRNVNANVWDFGFLLVLGLLLPIGWRLSNVWVEGADSGLAKTTAKLVDRFTAVHGDAYEFTASLGVYLGMIAAIFLVWVLVKEEGISLSGTWDLLNIAPSTASGLAWGLPFVGTVVSTFLAMMFLTAISVCRCRVSEYWCQLVGGISNENPDIQQQISTSIVNTRFGLSTALFYGFLVVGTFALIKAAPLGVTAMGFYSDTGFFLALIATSFVAIGSIALALNLYEFLDLYLTSLKRVTSRKNAEGSLEGLFLEPWGMFTPRGLDKFSVTPMVARPNWFPMLLTIEEQEMVELRKANANGNRESDGVRHKVREMISRQIWCIRWSLILGLLSCLASVMLVYYYPVPGRDGFLTMNMALMMVGAVLFAVFTLRLERNAVASRLLCDRGESIKWSFGMINAIALPFILIAIAATISEVPGVREITSDFLIPVLSLLGFRLF